MTPSAIISQLIPIIDGVDATDTDNAGRRVRYLFWIQHINNYVWMYREWEWTFATIPLTILGDPIAVGYDGGDKIVLPANFLELSSHGGLFDSTGLKWSETSVYRLEHLRIEGLGTINTQEFAIFNGRIQIPFVTSSDIVFTLVYRIAPDVLTDTATLMTIPDRYKDTVIIPGVITRAQESKGDARVQQWAGYFTDGLSLMCARERPRQTRFKQWPGSIPSHGGW